MPKTYHCIMRRALFSLLILLIAFRGMVGDAMAYGMTSGLMQQSLQNVNATESIAARADSMPAIGHLSSENMASMPCHEASDDAPADAASHACTTCQVCHLTASLPSSFVSLSAQPLRNVQTAWQRTWNSAELQPTQKPPIL
jgi:hypothetical protein